MTFRQLAVRNIRGSWQRYTAYFLSCVFSVLIFYLFASFIAHPVVMTGHIVGGGRQGVTQGLLAAEVVILIFSFLFILYSTTAFLRSRKKEFGLLTLMGMTASQLKRMLLVENAAIAGLALVGGLSVGILFSKLFFMAMSVLLMLENPIPFAVPPLAVGGTLLVFSGMFLALTVVSLLGVRQSSVVKLLKARRDAQPAPKFSPLLLACGLLLLASGYALAWVTGGNTFTRNMFPILGLVIAGTYLTVVHGGVAVCRYLQSQKGTLWRGTNVVTINRVVFRLRNNARIIFVTTILIAVVCSALGAFNTVLQNARSEALSVHPYAVSFLMPVDADGSGDLGWRVQQVLEDNIGQAVNGLEIGLLNGRLLSSGLDVGVSVISASSYTAAAQILQQLPQLTIEPGSGALLDPYNMNGGNYDPNNCQIMIGDRALRLGSVQVVPHGVIYPHVIMVVNDQDWQSLQRISPTHEQSHFFAYEFKGWEKHYRIGATLQQAVDLSLAQTLRVRVDGYSSNRQIGALTMFIGVFVSLLFFLASASLLYFKLFTEAEDDRQQFNVLRQIGLTKRELRRIVNQELGVLFFLPIAIGAVHTAFALKTLSNLLTDRMDIVMAGSMVAATYIVLQIGCFFLVRLSYLKQMIKA